MLMNQEAIVGFLSHLSNLFLTHSQEQAPYTAEASDNKGGL